MKHTSSRRRLAALLITGAGLLAASPAVHAAPVQSGTLAWGSVNAFEPQTVPPSNPPKDRTWFGYVTNPTPRSGANGTVTPVAPAHGPSLTGTSDRGPAAAVRWGFPAASGDYDPSTRTGDIEFTGELRYGSTAHRFDFSLKDPRVVLDGDQSFLYASGVRTAGRGSTNQATTFDRSQPVFKLNLDGATFTPTQIKNIQPSIATQDWAFPNDYLVGDGPDRDPNTFGRFDLTVAPTLTATPTADLDGKNGATTPMTVSGEGFKTSGNGLYVFYAPIGAAWGGTTTAGVTPVWSPGFDTSQPEARIASDGSWSTTINVAAKGGSGTGAFDCRLVACAIRTVAAHRDLDPTQRTSVALSFLPSVDDAGGGAAQPAAPVVTPAAAPPAVTPPAVVPPALAATRAPAVSRARLARNRLSFRLNRPGVVTGTVQKRVVRRVNGKRVVRWRTVRTIEREVRRAGNVRVNPRLRGKGRFRVVLRTLSTTGAEGKTTVVRTRLR